MFGANLCNLRYHSYSSEGKGLTSAFLRSPLIYPRQVFYRPRYPLSSIVGGSEVRFVISAKVSSPDAMSVSKVF